jgi:hypothetical protein
MVYPIAFMCLKKRDELGANGKAHWVTSREDKIVAKGKGEMQTYLINIRSSASTSDNVSCRVSCDLSNDGPLTFQPDQDKVYPCRKLKKL